MDFELSRNCSGSSLLKDPSTKSKDIRLVRNFKRFFRKFSFYFLTSKIQLAFNHACSIAIYDLSATLRQRNDLALVEVLGFLAKEVEKIHFEVVLVVEFFLS